MAFSYHFRSFPLVCGQINVSQQPGCFFGWVCPRTAGLTLSPTSLWMAAVISCCVLDAHCYFLVCTGWSLLFPGVLHMVNAISGWSLLFPIVSCCTLDGHCYFLVCSGGSWLFPGAIWMVTAISWCPLDGRCCFLLHSGWSLLFFGALWMVGVSSWCALEDHGYFLVLPGWSLLFLGSFTSNTCHTEANTRQM